MLNYITTMNWNYKSISLFCINSEMGQFQFDAPKRWIFHLWYRNGKTSYWEFKILWIEWVRFATRGNWVFTFYIHLWDCKMCEMWNQICTDVKRSQFFSPFLSLKFHKLTQDSAKCNDFFKKNQTWIENESFCVANLDRNEQCKTFSLDSMSNLMFYFHHTSKL